MNKIHCENAFQTWAKLIWGFSSLRQKKNQVELWSVWYVFVLVQKVFRCWATAEENFLAVNGLL